MNQELSQLKYNTFAVSFHVNFHVHNIEKIYLTSYNNHRIENLLALNPYKYLYYLCNSVL